LKRNVTGEIVLPEDSAYDAARSIWNAMIDKRPALIVRCASTSDVVNAVNFARKSGLPLAIRGGGHNIAGNALCDGGIVIDLSSMKAAKVDPRARRITIEAGALLADMDAATQAHGLATPLGINSTTGVAGLTLGGGFGWLSRKYGMTIDNLESAEVVTAAGEVVRASATEHPDLFWALRGGSGNFGVVTRFEFRLHPVGPNVLSGLIVYPFSQAKSVLQQYRKFTAQAPDELAVWAVLRQAPPLPFLPPEIHGKEVVVLAICYAGDPAEGERTDRAAAQVRHARGRTHRRPAVHGVAAGLRPAPHPRCAQLLEVAQFLDARRQAVRRRHRVHREAAVAAVRDLLRRHRGRYHPAGAGRDGVRTPRRPVRHERPRPLG
jgi:FAD/FMN-containing dehydrogenase